MSLSACKNPTIGHTLGRVRNEVERVFDRLIPEAWGASWTGKDGANWMPLLDVAENEGEITVKAELPGVAIENTNVALMGNTLTISGRKDESKTEKRDDYFVSERDFGAFRRSIELPAGVDPERISAEQHNGVLTIHVAKAKSARPKHIPIRGMTTG
jgi:HSP20 family protein